MAFVFLLLPSSLILYLLGYFKLPLNDPEAVRATVASTVLGVGGIAVAFTLFHVLLKRAGMLFSSLVGYGMPLVALMWGVYYGEAINFLQTICLGIILSGIYLTRK